MTLKCNVINMSVDVTDLYTSANKIEELAKNKTAAYVCVSNVHMCIEAFDSLCFRTIVNTADLTIPDGKPIAWSQRLLGYKDAKQVRGQDIMNLLCSRSVKNKLRIGLYGGSSSDILASVKSELSRSFPGISIVYSFSPPFRPLTRVEDRNIVAEIDSQCVDVLFVGIGCPKQEVWMAEHKDSLSCVMVGVGAAFDFIAGEKRHAPRWIQYIGFEWLFRLLSEPRRLWKRYFKTNPRFVLYICQQIFLNRKF